jgi:hypothetical protein
MYVVHVQQSRTPSLVAAFSMYESPARACQVALFDASLTLRLVRCPDRVIVGRELSRMLTAPLFHMDEWHLYQNMYDCLTTSQATTQSLIWCSARCNNRLSFLWKGYHLEKTLGSARFALLLLGLVLLSQSLVIATAYLLSRYMYFMGVRHVWLAVDPTMRSTRTHSCTNGAGMCRERSTSAASGSPGSFARSR